VGATSENRSNLAAEFFASITAQYEGTRLGRQELNAEILEDTEGALWKLSDVERARVKEAPRLVRIVVAIDPATTSRAASDETGIIVAGAGADRHGYVLQDLSGRYSPDGWARRAIRAFDEHGADRVIAEVNNGGELVEHTLRTVRPAISYKAVHASRGKQVRAEPVAALYEQGKVHHGMPGGAGGSIDELCAGCNAGLAGPAGRAGVGDDGAVAVDQGDSGRRGLGCGERKSFARKLLSPGQSRF
jgi:phage terminase large subunit-like protein